MFRLFSQTARTARTTTGVIARTLATEPATVAAPKQVAYPYFVNRTRFQSLPVYIDIRNGKTRKLTVVRRIEGDLEALRTDLSQIMDSSFIQIKKLSQQIVVKGDRQEEIRKWLAQRGF